jgi:hypothetical protein
LDEEGDKFALVLLLGDQARLKFQAEVLLEGAEDPQEGSAAYAVHQWLN